MKIGVVVDNEFFTDIRVRTEVDILKNAGHEVFVLHLMFETSKKVNVEGIETKAISIERKKKDFIYATMNWNPSYEKLWSSNITEFINNYNLDVLHVHDLYMAKCSRKGIEKSKRNIDLTLDLHENYPYAIQLYEWATKFPRNLLVQPNKWLKKEREYLKYADKIVVLSDYFANYLSQKFNINRDKFVVYPNVPNIDYFASFDINKSILDKGDKVTLFYFGAVAKRRGIYTMIEGYKLLKKDNDKLQLLIIGPVDKKDKAKFNSLIKSEKDIIHYEWKDMSDFPSYVYYSDICISPLEKNPQHESGVANKVYQYMLYSKPVVVSNCGPQSDLIESTNSGLVYKHDSVKDFVSKTKLLIDNSNLREDYGENGREAIYNKYNVKFFDKYLLGLYK
ncbi:MAG: glycosyltransferase [Flavobacteriales bacterium]|nr:glycosyltransferase [Flavobacteriales bacterium]